MDVVNKQISCQQLSNKGAENSIRGELSMGFLMIHLFRACSVGTGTEQLTENISALHTPKSGDGHLLLAISCRTNENVFRSRDQPHALKMKRWFRCTFTFLAPGPFPQDTLPQKGVLHYRRAWYCGLAFLPWLSPLRF